MSSVIEQSRFCSLWTLDKELLSTSLQISGASSSPKASEIFILCTSKALAFTNKWTHLWTLFTDALATAQVHYEIDFG